MGTKQQREPLLQGRDTVVNAVVAYLVAQGWSDDRILRNTARKKYSPHWATIRVERDFESGEYWARGEYVSEGRNVLGTRYACIRPNASTEEIATAMAKFIEKAEDEINQSFAVRFLGALQPGLK